MKILLSGSEGYIGVLLNQLLQKKGHEVIGLDTRFFRESAIEPLPENSTLKSLDIRSIKQSDIDNNFDVVIHLAGLSNDPLGSFNASLTNQINYRSTIDLAVLAKRNNIPKFIFSSSCSVYGQSMLDFLDENSPTNPVTPYGESKINSEIGLRELADDQFKIVCLRNATVFGYSPMIRFDLVVNNFVAWSQAEDHLLLKSTGKSKRPFVHVADVCKAFLAVAETDRIDSNFDVFNISNEHLNMSIYDLAQMVSSIVKPSKISFQNKPERDIRNYTVSCEKYNRLFPEYIAQVDMETGIQDLDSHLKQYKFTTEDIEGVRFSRLETLKYLIATDRLDEQLNWR